MNKILVLILISAPSGPAWAALRPRCTLEFTNAAAASTKPPSILEIRIMLAVRALGSAASARTIHQLVLDHSDLEHTLDTVKVTLTMMKGRGWLLTDESGPRPRLDKRARFTFSLSAEGEANLESTLSSFDRLRAFTPDDRVAAE